MVQIQELDLDVCSQVKVGMISNAAGVDKIYHNNISEWSHLILMLIILEIVLHCLILYKDSFI